MNKNATPKPCVVCGRPPVARVRKKYPARTKFNHWLCGLHLRSYKTSEYAIYPYEPEGVKRKRSFGYAPVWED